ncbi:rab-GTPase-TBC domain-containing protein [Umbelopsis sp. PMI_123]|nr:rab-GTPase-TBC domain-containing protein [Umbelopsis sp. PMI_123]
MSDEGAMCLAEPVSTLDQRDLTSSAPSTDLTQDTLAQRRRIPTQKLKLFANMKQGPNSPTASINLDLLNRLAEQNAQLPPQESTEFLLARLERQNSLLDNDPKSVCIESNQLKAHFDTLHNLVTDSLIPNQTDTGATDYPSSPLKMNFDTQQQQQDPSIDWDFWGCLIDDFPKVAAKLPHLLSAKIRAGVPQPLRGLVWQTMSQSSATNLESLYEQLSADDAEKSRYERIINRDLARTFPTVDMFKLDGGSGQQAMGRILKAYSMYDAHVGYCQGLAFLVGPLLMNMPEKQAFCVFVRLMETYDIRTMFTLNMEGLHLRLHQLQTLLSQTCPKIATHLSEHAIHPAMYASQWYLTLFAYCFPISLVLRIYDVVFAEGAVETIMRIAIALLRKNEEKILALHDFEQLMDLLCSKRLYEEAYGSDPERVIHDAMELSSLITKHKMDEIAALHEKEIGDEKKRAEQVFAIRFGGGLGLSNSKRNKRESGWFSWGSSSASPDIESKPASTETVTSPTTEEPVQASSRHSPSTAVLHQQIEDLVTVLSQLQKDQLENNEQLMAAKMREMDAHAEREALIKRNTDLERDLKKYKARLSNHTDMSSGNQTDLYGLGLSPKSLDSDYRNDQQVRALDIIEQDSHFATFVESLKLTGDFGSLVAGALTVSSNKPIEEEHQNMSSSRSSSSLVSSLNGSHHPAEDSEYDTNATTTVEDSDREYENERKTLTQELVNSKLANFEMGQKYEKLCHNNEELKTRLKLLEASYNSLSEKYGVVKNEADSLRQERDQLFSMHDELYRENDSMRQQTKTNKKMASELQFEKLSLARELEESTNRIKKLEAEKEEAIAARRTFSEDVFDAFNRAQSPKKSENNLRPKDLNRRHTVQFFHGGMNQDSTMVDYQEKYVESDLRCRELEKLLAEAKLKLVEYETSNTPLTSPRPSMQSSYRPSRHSSVASLSMLAARSNTNTPATDRRGSSASWLENGRQSTDSIMSNVSGVSNQSNNKRSSMYARMWNAFGSTRPSTDVAVVEEDPDNIDRCSSPVSTTEKVTHNTTEYPNPQAS